MNIKNFQKSSVHKPKCKDCAFNKKCEIVYDKHHDEHFSLTCGLVVMENNIYAIDFYSNGERFWLEHINKHKQSKVEKETEERRSLYGI